MGDVEEVLGRVNIHLEAKYRDDVIILRDTMKRYLHEDMEEETLIRLTDEGDDISCGTEFILRFSPDSLDILEIGDDGGTWQCKEWECESNDWFLEDIERAVDNWNGESRGDER